MIAKNAKRPYATKHGITVIKYLNTGFACFSLVTMQSGEKITLMKSNPKAKFCFKQEV